jgi:hypothetical protein
MGLICPCEVSVNAFSENNNVSFEPSGGGTVEGTLTYLAELCSAALETSTLSLSFVDTEFAGANSFTFTATEITSVVCDPTGQNCFITVTGSGTVTGQVGTFNFEAVFLDGVAIDNVQSFFIDGFFDQNGAAPVDNGSIVALNCQEAEESL